MPHFSRSTFLLALPALVSGCTYFELPDKDDWVIGRTMELGNLLNVNHKWEVVLHPRGEDHHNFRSKYGYMSIEADALPGLPALSFEGMNEAGLSASALSLRTSVYEKSDPTKTSVSALFFVPWMLANFQKTEQVVAALENVTVVDDHLPSSMFGLHWAITDTEGNSVVIEYVKGHRRVHRNDVRVMTNDPAFDWHVTNLDAYVFVSPDWVNDNNKRISVSTRDFGIVPTALGHGYNLGGLPGDMSPTSRFVRMFYLKQYAMKNAPPASTDDTIVLATGLINNVYLTVGSIASSGLTDPFETTGYAIVKMPKSGKYFIRSQQNMQWRLVDVQALDWTTRASFYVETGFRAGVQDDTGLLKKRSEVRNGVSLTV